MAQRILYGRYCWLWKMTLVLMHVRPNPHLLMITPTIHLRSVALHRRNGHRSSVTFPTLLDDRKRPFHSSTNTRLAASKSPIDASNTVSRLPPLPDHCHRFVLMRHGESAFNNANIFTGWCDVALTQRGVVEAVEAGEVFLSQSLHFRKCYVSLLSRSIVTAHRALDAGGVAYTPLDYDYRWNERHYGALQGLSKEQTAVRMGRSIVMKWRRSYSDRPPLMTGKFGAIEKKIWCSDSANGNGFIS
jgi:Histidine phosphatase superfamily (branch 1)